MRSFISSFRDRRIAAFLLGTAIFAVLELVLTWVLPNPAREELQQYRQHVLSTRSGSVEVMGDSAAYYGVSCEQLNADPANKGQSFAMLAGAGTGPVFTYYALKEQLAHGITPKAIVYLPSPHTFASSRFAKFVACYATPKEALGAAWHTWEFSDLVYGLLCRASYSLRYREELASLARDFDRSALTRLGLGKKGTAAVNSNAHLGVVPGDNGKPGTKIFTAADLSKSTFGKPFSVLSLNDWAVRQFCKLCSTHRIPIIWDMMPVPQAVRDSRVPFDFDKAYTQYVIPLPSRSAAGAVVPQIMLMVMHPPVYTDECFRDPVHLNKYGREKFSEQLATVLLPVLDDLGGSPGSGEGSARN